MQIVCKARVSNLSSETKPFRCKVGIEMAEWNGVTQLKTAQIATICET